ncbi:MAG: monovalent cation/H+ antiporter complex subunit F [Oscillospiraceae bacterium]
MAEKIYGYFFICSMCVLALCAFVYLTRTMLGPHFADRILAVNSISTIVVLIMSMLAILQGEAYIVDIGIIYALLGFITVIILCKAYLRSHKKERADDLKNLKPEGENND